jgi:trigger factor
MKIEIENLQGHFKKLNVEVPADKVTAKINDVYRQIQRNAELKGFRKGKAPIEVVKKAYAGNAEGQIIREIVEEAFSSAIREHSLTPVSNPQVNVETLAENTPFKFQLTFENQPPVELKDYTGFKTEKPKFEASDEDLTKALDGIRTQLATFEELPPNTPVAKGHFVQLDYEAEEAGKAVPEATDKDAFLETGTGQLPADFEANVIGMKAGDTKTFSVKLPVPEKEEERTPLSGRTLDFKVSLKGVRTKTMPVLDDELAKKVGPFEGLAQLKTRVTEDLTRQKELQWKREAQEKAVSWLIERNPVEAPETMINSQLEQLAVDAGMQLSQMGLDEAAIGERLQSWGGEMQERATRMVKASLLLGAIAKKESIQAADEDVRQEILRIAAQSRRKPQEVVEDLQQKGLMGGLIRQVSELKALDWILGKATGGA